VVQKQRSLPQAVSAAANILLNCGPSRASGGRGDGYVASELILALGYAGLVLKWVRTGALKAEERA
jgi:hypothetical protein